VTIDPRTLREIIPDSIQDIQRSCRSRQNCEDALILNRPNPIPTRLLPAAVMLLGVVLLYLPPGWQRGDMTLLGFDFLMLHQYRIAFAQDALTHGGLPGWYPREFCGSPFWANVQNFPFIPSRLILLWLPTMLVFTAGVMLSALLAAGFTYLLARRWEMGRVGAATAGWTFAASGFFASRVAAGHLPLLEAYPALPLLLWLIDRATVPSTNKWLDRRLLALALATGAMALAGHPQLWVYALTVAIAYTLVVAGGRALWILASIGAGLATAGFALVPMLSLIARSTRAMALERAPNDIAMPYARLRAAFDPWRDYKPAFDAAMGFQEFTASPHTSYFWDTVWYIGLWPWAAVILLASLCALRRVQYGRRAAFVTIAGVAALLLALPITRELVSSTGGTWLRSPARWVYVSIFSVSLAAGAGTHWLLQLRPNLRLKSYKYFTAGVLALLAIHALDLGRHGRHFINTSYPPLRLPADLSERVRRAVGDGRAAIDLTTHLDFNRTLDDVSLFDSILLARSYRAFLAMKNAPATYNNQWLPAFGIDARVLRAWGARVVITRGERGLPLTQTFDGVHIYEVPRAEPRAAFVPIDAITYGTAAEAERALRNRQAGSLGELLFIEREDGISPDGASSLGFVPLVMARPGPDRIEIPVEAPADGYICIAEAYDPGWRATLNGAAAAIEPANLMLMAVRVPQGEHQLVLSYHTPGRWAGLCMTILGLAGLLVIGSLSARRNRHATVAQELMNQRLDRGTQ